MLPKSVLLLALSAAAAAPAMAGSCDRYVRAADSARGEALFTAFDKLLSCDADLAKKEFGRFARHATDLQTLQPITVLGIDAGSFDTVWAMMDKVPYEFRTDLAKHVGGACTEHDDILPFLQASYVTLKGTEFSSWQPALAACGSEEVTDWLEGLVAEPPTSPYNDKYNAVITTFRDIRHVDALATLEQAAIKAGSRGGPFNNLIDTIQRSIEPETYGADVPAEHTQAMIDTMVRVAKAVQTDNARMVADQLYAAGHEGAAASLLPKIFPDRIQDGDEMLWAGAAVEACEGEAIIHWTSFTEPPARWSVAEAVQAPLRDTKAKLKCEPEGEWPVIASMEPLADDDAVDDWLVGLVDQWTEQGFDVKLRREKKVEIPAPGN